MTDYEQVRQVTPHAAVVLQHNPTPMTLDGTNTWLLRDPAARETIVVDPGQTDDAHLEALLAAVGDVALIVLTHRHPDHSEIAPALHDAVLAFYRQHGVDVQPRQRAVQMATLIHLVSADFGLAWVPASMQALQRAQVVYRPAPRGAPQCQTWLLAAEPRPPVVDALLRQLG